MRIIRCDKMAHGVESRANQSCALNVMQSQRGAGQSCVRNSGKVARGIELYDAILSGHTLRDVWSCDGDRIS